MRDGSFTSGFTKKIHPYLFIISLKKLVRVRALAQSNFQLNSLTWDKHDNIRRVEVHLEYLLFSSFLCDLISLREIYFLI